MDELEYTLKMNKRAIDEQLKKIVENTQRLQTLIESNNYHGYDSMCWVDGHVAQDIAGMSALIARQRTLTDALHMVKNANLVKMAEETK